MWERLRGIKPVFVEPKGKTDFNQVRWSHDINWEQRESIVCQWQTIEGYYEKIRDPEHNAAVFFAVCRGKVCCCSAI